MATTPPPGIISAPAPWTCRFKAWWILVSSGGRPLPPDAIAPLEEEAYAKVDIGKPAYGPGMIQIVRYSETPVGPYDELILIPGAFTNPKTSSKNHRVTRIYVSQKDTCWNGRHNWNIPKHLARFAIQETSNSVSVQVFPPDESATEPFFAATIKPFRYFPAFPFSMKMASLCGISRDIVMPPLPASDLPGMEILCATDVWKKSTLDVYSSKSRFAWVDLTIPKVLSSTKSNGNRQGEMDEDTSPSKGWWPTYKPWRVGMWLENATLDLTEATDLG